MKSTKLSPKLSTSFKIIRTLPPVFYRTRLEAIAEFIRGRAPVAVINDAAMRLTVDATCQTLAINGVKILRVTENEVQPGFLPLGLQERL